MLTALASLLWLPLLACLILTFMHGYLGLHVLAREVIFVDIALAQVAALGTTVAFLFGYDLDSAMAYWLSLGFTLAGAAILAGTRRRERHISQEAVIGVVYAVSAAAAILLLDRAPRGVEHIKAMLVGSLLTVTPVQVAKTAGLYGAVGLFLWWAHRPLILISAALDIPTGATIVCVFGLTLVAAWIVAAWKRLATGWAKRFSVTKVFERCVTFYTQRR